MKQFLRSRPTLKVGGLRHPMRGERGAVAIIVAVAMFALLALILLAVQVGTIGTVRALLQGSADQAAMSGATQLDGTSAGLAKARSSAMDILSGGKNFPSALNDGTDLSIAGDAFQTGTWNLSRPDLGFTESTIPEIVNAVRVVGRKTGALNGPVDMFLGGAFGPDTVSLSRTGIAARGLAAFLPCRPELPLAVCKRELQCGQLIRLLETNSNVDNAAWTGYTETASADTVRDMIKDCTLVPAVRTGSCVTLNNGQITSAYHDLLKFRFDEFMAENACPNVRLPDKENPGCDLCGATPGGDPIDIHADEDGNSTPPDALDCGLPVAIPLIPCLGDGPDDFVVSPASSGCSGDEDLGNFQQTRQVTGFALFVITKVMSTSSPKYIEGVPLCGITFPDTPTGPGPSCGPQSPAACAAQPILVNADVTS